MLGHHAGAAQIAASTGWYPQETAVISSRLFLINLIYFKLQAIVLYIWFNF